MLQILISLLGVALSPSLASLLRLQMSILRMVETLS